MLSHARGGRHGGARLAPWRGAARLSVLHGRAHLAGRWAALRGRPFPLSGARGRRGGEADGGLRGRAASAVAGTFRARGHCCCGRRVLVAGSGLRGPDPARWRERGQRGHGEGAWGGSSFLVDGRCHVAARPSRLAGASPMCGRHGGRLRASRRCPRRLLAVVGHGAGSAFGGARRSGVLAGNGGSACEAGLCGPWPAVWPLGSDPSGGRWSGLRDAGALPGRPALGRGFARRPSWPACWPRRVSSGTGSASSGPWWCQRRCDLRGRVWWWPLLGSS